VQAKREARKETQSVLLRLHLGSSPSPAAKSTIASLGSGGGAGNGEAAPVSMALGFSINELPSTSQLLISSQLHLCPSKDRDLQQIFTRRVLHLLLILFSSYVKLRIN